MGNLTEMAINGAIIAPVRPIIEQKFIRVVRKLVGHCSAVNMYKTANPKVIDALPIINNINTVVEFSLGMKGVTIMETAVIANAINIKIRRFSRLNNGSDASKPGTSTATTNMKLV